MKNFYFKLFKLSKTSGGFTLVELLAAMVITLIVTAIAGGGLVTITAANVRQEDDSVRRLNLNRALDFIADDIRRAVRINNISTTTQARADLAATAANTQLPFNPPLPILNTSTNARVLYLEIPTGSPILSCTNPPSVDRVVYDIRITTNTVWLGPRRITRYGRIPVNGNIDPCSTPQVIDLVDSVLDVRRPAPPCTPSTPTPVLSGVMNGYLGGFYSCVSGAKVELLLAGKLIDNPIADIDTTIISRSCRVVPDFVWTPLGTRRRLVDAKTTFVSAGFTGTFNSPTLTADPSSTTQVLTQSPPANGCQPANTSITVTP